MEIIKKKDRVIYKVKGETINIPSRMYPLEADSFKCFDADNTLIHAKLWMRKSRISLIQ